MRWINSTEESGIPPAESSKNRLATHRVLHPGFGSRRFWCRSLWIIPAAGSLTFSLKKFSSMGAHNSSRISPARRFQIFPAGASRGSGSGLPIQNDGDRGGCFFRDGVHQEPLAVRRDHVLIAGKGLQRATHTRGEEWHGRAGFNGLTI